MAWHIPWSSIVMLAAMLFAVGATPAEAQSPPDRTAAVYLYQGGDRAQRLVEGARQEATLVVYTSLATSESIPLTQAFEKRYGIKVQLWRALSEQVVQRAISEARARRNSVDVIETNGPELEMLARERITSQFWSPHVADLPAWAVPAHRLWVADRVDFFVVAFNTAKVRRDELPSTYEGFLDPKWKGRLALEATDQEWLAGVAKRWGEARALEFFRRLAAMKPEVRKGHVLLSELVAAGEVPVNLTNYSANAESMKRRGRPIDWVPVEPVVGRPQALGLAKHAPHPHAALLFADFVLAPEGQQMFQSMGRIPVSRRVRSGLGDFQSVMLDPATVLDEADKWRKVWDESLRP